MQSPINELRQRFGYVQKRLAELDTFIATKEMEFDGKDAEWIQAKWERTQKRRELRSILFNLNSYGQIQLLPPSSSQPRSASSSPAPIAVGD